MKKNKHKNTNEIIEYKCFLCGIKILYPITEKRKWIKSWCDKLNKYVRLQRVK